MTTITMDLNTFLTPLRIEFPTWKFLDGVAYTAIIAELSSINETLKTMCHEILSPAKLENRITALRQAVDAGESVDFEQAIAFAEEIEREYGRAREQVMSSFNVIEQNTAKKFPEKSSQVEEIRADMLHTLNEAIEELRALRFQLMALEAQAEHDDTGIVLKSPEDVRNLFLSFS
ncbi:MAG: hypothetical protein HQL73_07825 [Magnetococcales bacterium]|nr:hypothetical protein [Magnetococcales bacterium]